MSDGGVTLTLWLITDPGNAVAFNRKTNIGLHHLAFAVADQAALAKVYERVWQPSRRHRRVRARAYRPRSAIHHFICIMPGGIRIEFATSPELTAHNGSRLYVGTHRRDR